MLDLKMIRTEPDKVKAAIQKREMNLDSVIDEILKIDVDRRAVTGKVEAKKAEQNAASKQIPAMKKAGQDTTELMAQMKVLSAEIKEYDAELGELEEKQKDLMLSLPNLPDEDVVAGGKEQNVPLHYFKAVSYTHLDVYKRQSQIMGIPESCPLKGRRGMKWVSARGQQAAFRIGAGWDGGGKEKRLKAVGPCPAPRFHGCAAAHKGGVG